MNPNNVKVYYSDLTSSYSVLAQEIEDLYRKYGERLVTWQIIVVDDWLKLFYVLADEPKKENVNRIVL